MRTILACSTTALILCIHALATPLPSEPEHVRSLDGVWRFKIEQLGVRSGPRKGNAPIPPIITPKEPAPFEKLDYKEDATWHDLKVPGNWEIAGFTPATYNAPDNAIGLYRLSFDVPAEWKGRTVKIDFDGVQNGAEIFCNGQPVNVDEASDHRKNYHESGWTAFQADLTPAVKFGEKNLLAIRVTKDTKSVDLDSGDYFFLGGIYRTVRLFSVPSAHAEDLTVRTTVPSTDKAELRVLLALPPGAKASAKLGDLPPVEGQANAQGKLELAQTVDQPKLWSAEHPNLYDLNVEVKDDAGKVSEAFEQRVGLREVTIKDGVLLLNNVPVKFTGMCRHDVWPTLGTALDDAAWRKDLTLMKANNINAIRTSHYPYGSRFYDLCDEMGFYVMDEMAACWTPTDTDALSPAFAQHARETVRRDKNHASVVIWAIGNENKPGKNNKVAADEIKKIDPTRPRLVSWRSADDADVEIDDAHYTTPEKIAAANREPRRAKFPKTYLENPNNCEIRNGADFGCTYRWAAVVDRVWREVWQDEHIPGSFYWEWVDRAVADQCDIKLYDYFPQTGIQLIKIKGLVDAYRNPRPSLYDVKMAYAPVKIEPNIKSENGVVTFDVTNRYSFTNLSEFKITAHFIKDAKDIAAITGPWLLPPRTEKVMEVHAGKDVLAAADTLRLTIDAPDNRNIVTYDYPLKPANLAGPDFQLGENLSNLTFPRFNLSAVTYGLTPTTAYRNATRHSATLADIDLRTTIDAAAHRVDEKTLDALPLETFRSLDAAVMLPSDALGDPAATGKAKTGAAAKTTDTAPVRVAHLRVELAAGKFSWRLTWSASEKADVQELGWAFPVSKEADHFAWHRQGYWSYYPPDHIGRIEGVATPDSMNVQLTRMDRPDGFDFNSTKYDCDWARLTHDNQGLAFRFVSTDRQHCRAGIAPDGRYELIVNKVCAPPRDISSGVIPDYYFTAEKGTTVDSSFLVGGAK